MEENGEDSYVEQVLSQRNALSSLLVPREVLSNKLFGHVGRNLIVQDEEGNQTKEDCIYFSVLYDDVESMMSSNRVRPWPRTLSSPMVLVDQYTSNLLEGKSFCPVFDNALGSIRAVEVYSTEEVIESLESSQCHLCKSVKSPYICGVCRAVSYCSQRCLDLDGQGRHTLSACSKIVSSMKIK